MKNIRFSLILFVGIFTTSCEKTPIDIDVDLSGNYSGQLSTTISNCDPSINGTSSSQYTFVITRNSDGKYNTNGVVFNCNGSPLLIPSSGILNYDENCNSGGSIKVEVRITNTGELHYSYTSNLNGCRNVSSGTFYK